MNNVKLLKDEPKLVQTIEDKKKTTYILENNTYLSSSFNYLPNGQIDKRVTGIGATHLELTSPRNSIIVEPLKAIASMKASKHDAIYVGSKTQLHPTELNSKTIKKAIENHPNENIKILVVADSLYKVINAIGESVYKDYFFMVDEIDTFQSDAGFREKLERSIDYYFKFENKCVLSATLRIFSNPELQKEPLIIFDYANKEKKNFDITATSSKNIDNLIAEKVKQHFDSNEKLLVAYNSIIGILNVIEKLSAEDQKQCKILCSKNSQSKAGKYYQEFTIDFKLSHAVTFMTSAYYSGVDIDDSYHVICVANGSLNFTILSLDGIKQIIGRARKGTITNHFIYSKKRYHTSSNMTSDILISNANKTLKALECVRKVYADDNSSGELMKQVRDSVVRGANIKGYRLLRSSQGNYTLAYFNIDALLENERTIKELYFDDRDMLSNFEARYNIINKVYKFPDNVEDSTKDALKERMLKEYKKEVEQAIQLIENGFILKTLKNLIKESSGVRKKILLQFEKIQLFISKEDAIKYLKEFNIGKRDTRQFNNFYQALIFEALPDNHVFKRKMLQLFPLKSFHNKTQILNLINSVYARGDVGLVELGTHIQAIRQLKLYFKVITTRKKDVDGNSLYKIKSLNPMQLNVTTELGEGIKDNEMFEGVRLK